MYPTLWGLEPLVLLMPLVVLLSAWLMVYCLRGEQQPLARIIALQFVLLLCSLLGAKLFSLHVRSWDWSTLQQELEAGWRYPGGLIALALALPLFRVLLLPGLSLLRYADSLAIAAAAAMFILRLACFLAGCCTGAVNENLGLEYAVGSQVWYQHVQAHLVAATEPSLPVVPLHLLFMGASGFVLIFLLWFDGRRHYDGQTMLVYLVLHEGAKGFLEFYRVPFIEDLQVVSLVAALIGLVCLLAQQLRRASTINPAGVRE